MCHPRAAPRQKKRQKEVCRQSVSMAAAVPVAPNLRAGVGEGVRVTRPVAGGAMRPGKGDGSERRQTVQRRRRKNDLRGPGACAHAFFFFSLPFSLPFSSRIRWTMKGDPRAASSHVAHRPQPSNDAPARPTSLPPCPRFFKAQRGRQGAARLAAAKNKSLPVATKFGEGVGEGEGVARPAEGGAMRPGKKGRLGRAGNGGKRQVRVGPTKVFFC